MRRVPPSILVREEPTACWEIDEDRGPSLLLALSWTDRKKALVPCWHRSRQRSRRHGHACGLPAVRALTARMARAQIRSRTQGTRRRGRASSFRSRVRAAARSDLTPLPCRVLSRSTDHPLTMGSSTSIAGPRRCGTSRATTGAKRSVPAPSTAVSACHCSGWSRRTVSLTEETLPFSVGSDQDPF